MASRQDISAVVERLEALLVAAERLDGAITLTRDSAGYITRIDALVDGVPMYRTLTRDGDGNITSLSAWQR